MNEYHLIKNTKVKPLTKEHINQIVDIEKRSFEQPWSLESFIQTLEQKNYGGLGVFTKDQVIGYCLYYWAADELNVINIAVDPQFRSKKIGTLLLSELEDWAKHRGYHKIFLEVSVVNDVAQKLYKKMGYQKQARRLGYYTDGQDAIVMVKAV